jgi:hypothetical protein
MEVYQLIRRGQEHKDFCQDFLLAHQINGRFEIFGVFDGCSTGIDSHFASALMAKTIKAELEFIDLESLNSCSDLMDRILFQSIQSLKDFRNALMLQTDELLSTMIILILDRSAESAEILAFGDGLVSINGKDHLIDQNNQPEYIAYYLDMINTYEDYIKCMADYGQRFKIENVHDISISTDGINTFKSNGSCETNEIVPNPLEYLIHNHFLKNNLAMMSRKCNILKMKFGMVNQDDLALIRIVNQS